MLVKAILIQWKNQQELDSSFFYDRCALSAFALTLYKPCI
ncbi:hypothetical protein T12_7496 [Trichinella patagoniensis]|uniref:Uncharacterized protein n=1 Tax=Trichinella patagoniensis TaxID=990121 RepID=A0A0V0WX06_9BILA|nr:hypothetical protein T12_7496 [Trichinella patagoniensis]